MIPAPLAGFGAWPNNSITRSFWIYSARAYLYSDGVPEAMDPAGKLFGDARLLAAIAEGRSEPLEETIAALVGKVARWHGSERLKDDLSVFAVELLVAQGPCANGTMTLRMNR